MIDLIAIDGQSCISSGVISNAIGTTYKSTNRLIQTHKKRLETFGEVRFEITPKNQKKLAYLNEDQAIFILTLSKNTEAVVDFKHQLVTAFSTSRKHQAQIDSNHAKTEWQQNRALGKLIHHSNTDAIQTFIAYATAQGSSNYEKRGYSIFARMVNKALSVEDREIVTEHQLHLIATADLIVEKALLKGMAERLPYKTIYQQAKHEIGTFSAMIADRADKEKAPTATKLEGAFSNDTH